MSGLFGELGQHCRKGLERHRQRPFLRAVMGACAYVTMGGGEVRLGERVAVDRVLETLDRLRVFDPHEGVALFDDFVEGLRRSDVEGLRRVLEAVDAEVAREPDKADLLVRLCLAVCGGDHSVTRGERERIVALCRHLELEPCPAAESEV